MTEQAPIAYQLTGTVFHRPPDFTLRIPTLAIETGKVHAIVGANGSGKTTLLDLLAFLEPPSAGQVIFFGQLINAKSANLLECRRRLGMVFQEPYLFHHTLMRNAAFGPLSRGASRKDSMAKARHALEFTGMTQLQHRRGNQLSGGEKKRAALAMALASEPEVLLLDELTSNVDVNYQRLLEDLILKVNRDRDCTVIFTTHNLDQAYRLAHHVISLQSGTVIDFIPENIFDCHISLEGDRKIARIVGGPAIEVADGAPGPAKIMLDPGSLIVSRQVLDSSARNHLGGRITHMKLHNHTVHLTVDAGVPIVVRLTLASYQELKLDLGQNVVLTFKIHSVRVI